MRGVWALAVALGLAWGQGGTTRPGAPASTPRGRWRRPRPPASWASWSPPRTGRSCGFSCASTWTRGRWPRPRPTWTAWARTRRPPTSGPGPSSPRGGTGRFWPWARRGRRGGFSAPSPWSASGASRRRWPWPGAFPWTGRCGSFWGGFTWSWAGPWRGWPTWGTPRRKWSSRGGSSWPGGGLPRRPPSWRRSAPGFPRKAPSTGRPSPPWSSPASGGWTGRGVFRSGGARPGGEPPRPGACPPLALAPLRGGLPRASRLRGKPH